MERFESFRAYIYGCEHGARPDTPRERAAWDFIDDARWNFSVTGLEGDPTRDDCIEEARASGELDDPRSWAEMIDAQSWEELEDYLQTRPVCYATQDTNGDTSWASFWACCALVDAGWLVWDAYQAQRKP